MLFSYAICVRPATLFLIKRCCLYLSKPVRFHLSMGFLKPKSCFKCIIVIFFYILEVLTIHCNALTPSHTLYIIYTYTNTRTHKHTRTHTHLHKQLVCKTDLKISLNLLKYVYCVFVSLNTNTQTHTDTQTHTHKHTHTHTQLF